MSTINDTLIRDVVSEVLARLKASPASPSSSGGSNGRGGSGPAPTDGVPAARPAPISGYHTAGMRGDGIFATVEEAVAAAKRAQEQLAAAPLEKRAAAIQCIRDSCIQQADDLGRIELDETQIGRLDHKIEKLLVAGKTIGLETIPTEAVSGDHGLCVTEHAPWGVIGVITPVTHSVPTLACNAIMMIAAGNTIVVNPHPSGARCAAIATQRFVRAIREKTGLDNLVCLVEKPTLETAEQIFAHRDVSMLVVTGGPGVAKAAMSSNKKAIVAGPGNPPVVVDETADIPKAAAGIIFGAAYDNNLLCIGEKEAFVVHSVTDRLMEEMSRHGGFRLNARQIDQLTQAALHKDERTGHWLPDKKFVGKAPDLLAEVVKVTIPRGTQLLFGEVGDDSPWLPCEQMMPFLPINRCRDVDEAIRKAVHFEHGFGHTAILWSQSVDNMTKMGKAVNTTLFVKNGSCMAGLGLGGEGFGSFSIATPTGEGVTSPLTFTRVRRCVMVDNLRIL